MKNTKQIVIEHIHKELGQFQDSISLGTEAKGGNIKIYCNFQNVEEAKQKIDNALLMRKYAQEKINQEKNGE